MKKVVFWKVDDIVVSISEPAKTWRVSEAKNTSDYDGFNWVRLDCLTVENTISDNIEMFQKMGFVGYRNDE